MTEGPPDDLLEPTHSPEGGFSSEAIESIMERVQDINKKGNAFRVELSLRLEDEAGQENLQSILKNGLLGGPTPGERQTLSEEELKERDALPTKKERWVRGVRKHRIGTLFCNIIGRDIRRIEDSHWLECGDVEVGFVFSLEGFDELLPRRSGLIAKSKARSFKFETGGVPSGIRIHQGEADIFDLLGLDRLTVTRETFVAEVTKNIKKLRLMGVTERDLGWFIDEKFHDRVFNSGHHGDGFMVNFRIPPRKFIGIVIKPTVRVNDQKQGTPKFREVLPNEKDFSGKVGIVVKQMEKAYKGKEEKAIPIYDKEGNLLWPKRMFHVQIADLEKQRVAKIQDVIAEESASDLL